MLPSAAWSTTRAASRPGSLFVAMRGETTDGNRYIEQAVARGAVAVVTDSAAAYDATANGPLDVALVEVPHGRRALATIAANVFGHPERKIRLSGVTGTNGKTTTAYLLEQLLRAGRPLHGADRNDRIPHCRRGASRAAHHAGVARSAGAAGRGRGARRDGRR